MTFQYRQDHLETVLVGLKLALEQQSEADIESLEPCPP